MKKGERQGGIEKMIKATEETVGTGGEKRDVQETRRKREGQKGEAEPKRAGASK